MSTETATTTPAGPTDEQLVVDYLRLREAHCPVCHYNLHLLTVPRCPECGRELRLTVGTLEPFMRAWICLAVATFASAGLGLLFTCAFLIQGFPRHIDSLRDFTLVVAAVYLILNIPMSAAVIAVRTAILESASNSAVANRYLGDGRYFAHIRNDDHHHVRSRRLLGGETPLRLGHLRPRRYDAVLSAGTGVSFMTGHNATIGGGGFHHVAIKVSDFDRTIKLYCEGLGFKEKLRWAPPAPPATNAAPCSTPVTAITSKSSAAAKPGPPPAKWPPRAS